MSDARMQQDQSQPLRWGVGAVAGINDATVPAMLASETAQLCGFASRSAERAAHAAEQTAGIGYASYEAMLADEHVEAIYVPTPNAQHAEWVQRALLAGKHVLCEKPLAVTETEARALVSTAQQTGLTLVEAFMYAHHPRYTLLRQLLEDQAIGVIRGIHVVFTFDASDELEHSGFQGAPGSGAIYDVGCYAVHVARMLCDAEPEAITAHAAASDLHGGVDMSTSLLMEFPDGVGVTAQVGMWNADLDTITVIGSHGRIEVPSAFLRSDEDHLLVVTDEHGTRTLSTEREDHYRLQLERFFSVVREGEPPLFDAHDAVAQAVVLEAATESWRTRKRIPLSLG